MYRKKLIFLVFAGLFSLLLLIVSSYQIFMFTESVEFCGQLCHEVMEPEYTTYQASPHSNVPCVDCHVGPGADYLVKSKIRGIPQVFATILNTYPRPITTPVENLRPATGTCEQCHRPSIFSGDLLRTYTSYDANEENTEHTLNMVFRVGTGEENTAYGIHWHIVSKVWYLPMNNSRTEIGWVGVENGTGGVTEYLDPQVEDEVTAQRIEDEKRLMDCVDCHNRATHIFSSPEELLDKAMAEGRIDTGIPYIKREALKAVGTVNTNLETAYAKVDAINEFYQGAYQQFYNQNRVSVDNALTELKIIAQLTTFPDMNVTSTTHLDHSGHNDSPGCFRCHGKLVTGINLPNEKTLKDECNLCHYNPGPQPVPGTAINIPHSTSGLENCLSCHSSTGVKPYPADHTGRTNTVCTACHEPTPGAPQLSISATVIPHATTGFSNCLSCHGSTAVRPYPADHAGRTDTVCTICHEPTPGAPLPSASAAAIPHTIVGYSDCLSCHGARWAILPSNHTGRSSETCIKCHSKPTEPAQVLVLQAKRMDHELEEHQACLSCHGRNENLPNSHIGRSQNTCTVCHRPGD